MPKIMKWKRLVSLDKKRAFILKTIEHYDYHKLHKLIDDKKMSNMLLKNPIFSRFETRTSFGTTYLRFEVNGNEVSFSFEELNQNGKNEVYDAWCSPCLGERYNPNDMAGRIMKMKYLSEFLALYPTFVEQNL